MNLHKLMKLATPGPMIVEDGVLRHDEGMLGTTDVPLSRTGETWPTTVETVNAALLARAYNMLPELVEVLNAGQEIADSVAGNFDNGNDFDRALEALTEWAMSARALLAKASEVPGI